jgi:hypothetical protein
MPKANADRRRKVPPIVAAVVQPVARRLARMEALLLEVRFEQDVQIKRLNKLHTLVDILTEHVTRRVGKGKQKRRPSSMAGTPLGRATES